MNDKKLNVKLIRDNEKVDLTPEIYENLKKLSENWKEYFFYFNWNCIKRQDVFLNLFQHLLSTIQYIKERFYDERNRFLRYIFMFKILDENSCSIINGLHSSST